MKQSIQSEANHVDEFDALVDKYFGIAREVKGCYILTVAPASSGT